MQVSLACSEIVFSDVCKENQWLSITFVRHGLGILSWTSRGILLSRLGTLSNCRGEAKAVAARQERSRSILVRSRRNCAGRRRRRG